jgi:hypothetical protein
MPVPMAIVVQSPQHTSCHSRGFNARWRFFPGGAGAAFAHKHSGGFEASHLIKQD